jgi:hypothetical protein
MLSDPAPVDLKGSRLVHTDIPTRADLEQLLSFRGAACVSIYLPTAPEERGGRDRLEFKNLAAKALKQPTAASIERDSINSVRDVLDDLANDDTFWARQAHSLAVFATPSGARTFQVANRWLPVDEVSDRFHVKPLANRLSAGGGLLCRYLHEDSPDGIPGDEGGFVLCSFWLVENLARQGQFDKASELHASFVRAGEHARAAARADRPLHGFSGKLSAGVQSHRRDRRRRHARAGGRAGREPAWHATLLT